MAVFYQPRQRISDKRWDYTRSSDDERWCYPTGYCAGYTDPEETEKSTGFAYSEEEKKRYLEHKAKFHTDGHATAAEAEECYRTYELDFTMKVQSNPAVRQPCLVCRTWTEDAVTVGKFLSFVLCKDHQTSEVVAKAYDDQTGRRERREHAEREKAKREKVEEPVGPSTEDLARAAIEERNAKLPKPPGGKTEEVVSEPAAEPTAKKKKRS
jgi:hypothetical protein